MEKKLNLRPNQVPAKVLNSEPRKLNQDATGKQQARNLRRRDFSSSFSQTPKSDRSAHNSNNIQHKQNQLQIFAPKSRGTDTKRGNVNPQNANNNSTTTTNNNSDSYTRITSSSSSRLKNHYDDDNTEQISNDFEIELNSVYLPGSKKQNLNHLLNFNYAPRERTDPSTYMRSSGYIAKGYAYFKRAKYNKEQFLQANCQFVVKSKGDYESYTISPDQLVEWTSIEQINFFGSSEEPQCPICLYHPVAAKMTRCGHVYCWPCILHYLALSDKKSWRKCPICYEAVHVGDLKSAVSKPHRNYNCGELITFQLMRRNKNSLRVFKADATSKISDNADFPSLSDSLDELKHSKLVLAQPHEILSILDRERNELNCQLVSDGIDCPDSIFVQQALCLLEERAKSVRDQIGKENPVENTNSVNNLNEIIDKVMHLNADAKEFVPFDDKQSFDTPSDDLASNEFIIDENNTELSLKDLDIEPSNNTTNNNDYFYFYQSNDGQHLYLHSVNVRMLQCMYSSLEHAPQTIKGCILQKESCSMTDELRKRLKYLQHLPVTCQFDVAEIEFDSTVHITDDICIKFKDELAQRQKNRQRRAREEHKREKHIDRENERRIGKVIQKAINIDVTSVQQFPTCSNFDDTSFPMPSPSHTTGTETKLNNNPGPSFAKMLTSPLMANKSEKWPTLGRPKDFPIFSFNDCPPLGQTATRTANGCGGNAVSSNIEHSDEDSVDFAIDDLEMTYARPEFKESFGSAIAEALNKAALSKNPRKQQQIESTNSRSNPGKKKKATKKTVLFSTISRNFDGK